MIFFTADQHFGHENIIRYAKRPYESVGEMDNALIEQWNSVVGVNDTVYQLGDFTLLGPVVAERLFERLNGYIRVIPGGHDYQWIEGMFVGANAVPVTIEDPLMTLEIGLDPGFSKYPLPIILCHYAMRNWDRSHYGSIHLHGHSHGRIKAYDNTIDVGVDAIGSPISLIEVLKHLERDGLVEFLDPSVL